MKAIIEYSLNLCILSVWEFLDNRGKSSLNDTICVFISLRRWLDHKNQRSFFHILRCWSFCTSSGPLFFVLLLYFLFLSNGTKNNFFHHLRFFSSVIANKQTSALMFFEQQNKVYLRRLRHLLLNQLLFVCHNRHSNAQLALRVIEGFSLFFQDVEDHLGQTYRCCLSLRNVKTCDSTRPYASLMFTCLCFWMLHVLGDGIANSIQSFPLCFFDWALSLSRMNLSYCNIRLYREIEIAHPSIQLHMHGFYQDQELILLWNERSPRRGDIK